MTGEKPYIIGFQYETKSWRNDSKKRGPNVNQCSSKFLEGIGLQKIVKKLIAENPDLELRAVIGEGDVSIEVRHCWQRFCIKNLNRNVATNRNVVTAKSGHNISIQSGHNFSKSTVVGP